MAFCRFCGTQGCSFANAHIIPRSFFKIIRGDSNYTVMMRADGRTVETPYFQAGLSDNQILCLECEPKFSEWDRYGFEVLGRKWSVDDAIRRQRDDLPIAIQLLDINYEK